MTRIPRKPAKNAQPRITQVDGSIVRAKPSEQEMHERRMFVRQLMAAGMYVSDVIDRAVTPQLQSDGSYATRFDCSGESIRAIVKEIRDELKREQEVFAPTDRAAALQRMYGDLVNLRAELGMMRNQTSRDFAAIKNHSAEVRAQEKLIAELEGTLRGPDVRVTHGMSDALARALGGMSPEQQEEAVRQEVQLARDASSVPTTAEELPDGHHPEVSKAPALTAGGRRSSVPAPRRADPVGGAAPQGPAPSPVRRERSSDIAARRNGGASSNADVEGRSSPGVSGTRVL